MFSQEQLVVYPAQGVGVIERVETQEVGGNRTEFYIVRILGSNVTLMVPVKTARKVGLRDLSTPEECDRIMESLKERCKLTSYAGQNWNRRYREYSERLQTGSLIDSCHVLKELFLISGDKELSFGERRLLEQAMVLVSMEIACVLEREQKEIQRRIEGLFDNALHTAENGKTG